MTKTKTKKTTVCIIYPADPVGVIPGGIDTFIRGVIRWAPDDIFMRLIGVSTNRYDRPIGRWSQCRLGHKIFGFYPVLALNAADKQQRIPLSLKFSLKIAIMRPRADCQVLEFHRIEPSLLYFFSRIPKTAVIHQDMKVLRNPHSDIRWKHISSIYYLLEDIIIPRFKSIFAVREDAVVEYIRRYPHMGDMIHFLPTWVDPEVFYPPNEEKRGAERSALIVNTQMETDSSGLFLIYVGRLDRQKDPLLLINAFKKVSTQFPMAHLIVVGDGILRDAVEERIHMYGLDGSVSLTGVLPAEKVSKILRAGDLFVLSSAYEGMPMCVLEALGCGIPVVTTDVGEVRRVVKPGVNGEIVTKRDPESLAKAIITVLKHRDRYSLSQCTDAVSEYVPEKVLAPVYENYRRLARGVAG